MIKRPKRLWVLMGAILSCLLALAPVGKLAAQTFQFRFGTMTRPLSGNRYETMRALSHYLDGQASHAVRIAQRTAHHGDYREARLIHSMQSFSYRADDFHERMDRYLDSRWDLPPEVVRLDRNARRVSANLRNSHALYPVYDDWRDVLNTLDLMKRVLAGYRVQVPRAHTGYGRGNESYPYDDDRYNQNDRYNDQQGDDRYDQNDRYDHDDQQDDEHNDDDGGR
ncbi:MAG TPA: hypothetical protein VGR38_00765 [Candidatus Polarisedimenticolia bacterium]|nr:hypothetical protein [Candidatus Polarisedimenticolia bacterium]